MIKSVLKSVAIYAVIGAILFGSGKMISVGIDTMINTTNEMNDAINYCVTSIVDTDDVK